MGFRIRNNSAATQAYKSYSKAQADLEKNIQRLASGLRINSASDDISGAAQVTRMDNQIRGLQEASKNAKGASGLLNMAESGLVEINSILSRLRELTVQAASDQLTSDDRRNINLEVEQLTGEVGRIARLVEYNDIKLLNGSFLIGQVLAQSTLDALDPETGTFPTVEGGGVSDITLTGVQPGTYTFSVVTEDGVSKLQITDGTTVLDEVNLPTTPATGETAQLTFSTLDIVVTINENFDQTVPGTPEWLASPNALHNRSFTVEEGTGGTVQIGIDDTADSRLQFSIMDATAAGLNIDSINVDSVANARAAMSQLDIAISLISAERGKLGSVQNRLEFTMSNLGNMIQAIDSSRSAIRDVDFAKEMTAMARNQILVQSSSSILAQANQINQSVLGLLG